MENRKLTLYDADDIKTLTEKVDQILVDVVEIKVKMIGLVNQYQHLEKRMVDSEKRMNRFDSSLAGLKMIGITAAALWGIITTVIGLWLRMR